MRRLIAVLALVAAGACAPAAGPARLSVDPGPAPAAATAPAPSSATATATAVTGEPTAAGGATPTPGRVTEPATVVEEVVDGDTIRVSGVGAVRLIGIDTPETDHPERGVECFGPEASARTAELLPTGEPVRLTYDEERLDPFDRTLAYVERARDGLFVNGDLVHTGHARARQYPPNTARALELGDLERAARAAGAGLWSACPAADPVPAPTGPCDPSYPDVCVPPPPPDLSCADTDATYFRALPPDPHALDGNDDGVACEIPGR